MWVTFEASPKARLECGHLIFGRWSSFCWLFVLENATWRGTSKLSELVLNPFDLFNKLYVLKGRIASSLLKGNAPFLVSLIASLLQCFVIGHTPNLLPGRSFFFSTENFFLYDHYPLSFWCLARLNWKLKSTFLIARRPSVCPAINFSHFRFLLKNQ